MNWSPMQSAIFHWAETGSGSANVIARAGCGKTSTIAELTNRIQGRAIVCAFNRAIAAELASRITAPNVQARTVHSLGLSLWCGIRPSFQTDSGKVRSLARRYWPLDKKAAAATVSAVSYAKQAGFGLMGLDYTLTENWDGIFDHYDLWDEIPEVITPERITTACMEIYDDSLQMCEARDSVIDFDDMLLAPLLFGDPAPTYDWVMGDEWQDANEVRRRLMRWVLKKDGRAVFVADPAQSIYGFAGASVDSVELTKKEFSCIELPLSVTHRCPKQIVALAQTWVPDITAHESAPEGLVRTINHTGLWLEDFDPYTDAILCRNTRPLLGIAKRLRTAGIHCKVEGASGKAIIALAGKWGEISIPELRDRLEEYQAAEVAKWTEKGREDKVEWAVEKVSTLLDFCGDMREGATISQLVDSIERAYGESQNNPDVLKLCSVHRSKGLEWERVYLIGRNLYMPSKYARQDWEKVQERNLEYVAVTRAKRELVEVTCPGKKSGAESPEWWEAEA